MPFQKRAVIFAVSRSGVRCLGKGSYGPQAKSKATGGCATSWNRSLHCGQRRLIRCGNHFHRGRVLNLRHRGHYQSPTLRHPSPIFRAQLVRRSQRSMVRAAPGGLARKARSTTELKRRRKHEDDFDAPSEHTFKPLRGCNSGKALLIGLTRLFCKQQRSSTSTSTKRLVRATVLKTR